MDLGKNQGFDLVLMLYPSPRDGLTGFAKRRM